MEQLHSDGSVALSAMFGAVICTILLGTATWLCVLLVSLMGDQLSAMLRAISTAGL